MKHPLTIRDVSPISSLRLLDLLGKTLRMTDTVLTPEQLEFWHTELMNHPEQYVEKALYEVCVECRGRIYLADVMERVHKHDKRNRVAL